MSNTESIDQKNLSKEERLLAAIFGEKPEELQKKMKKAAELHKASLHDAMKLVQSESGKFEYSVDDSIQYLRLEHRKAINEYEEDKSSKAANRVVATLAAIHFLTEFSKEHKKGYNVLKAEQRIAKILSIINFRKIEGLPEVFVNVPKNEMSHGNNDLMEKVIDEIDQVANNTVEFCGYHINHIKSGHSVFEVVRNEPSNEEGVDEEIVTVGEYDTMEEAENACKDGEHVYEYDPNELFTIVDPDGKQANGMFYPSEERAIVFLLGIIKDKTPWWNIYEMMADQYDAMKKEGGEG